MRRSSITPRPTLRRRKADPQQSKEEMTEELNDIFATFSACTYNEDNEPVIPADNLFEVFRTYGNNHDGVQILKPDEEELFLEFLQHNPTIQATPQVIMGFVTARTSEFTEEELTGRGRDSGGAGSSNGSRSSSQGSSRGHTYLPSPDRRTSDSPFDSGRRQRTTPLHSTGPAFAPSSWNGRRPAPAARRKSDAGYSGRPSSDSEVRSLFCHLIDIFLQYLMHALVWYCFT